jgi:hypothetical protein
VLSPELLWTIWRREDTQTQLIVPLSAWFLANFFLEWFFDPEDRSYIFLRNVGLLVIDCRKVLSLKMEFFMNCRVQVSVRKLKIGRFQKGTRNLGSLPSPVSTSRWNSGPKMRY